LAIIQDVIPQSRAWKDSESIARQPKSYRSWRTLGRRIFISEVSAHPTAMIPVVENAWRVHSSDRTAHHPRQSEAWSRIGVHHQRPNGATAETIQVVENDRPQKAWCGSAMIQRPNGAPREMIRIVEEIRFCRVTTRITGGPKTYEYQKPQGSAGQGRPVRCMRLLFCSLN